MPDTDVKDRGWNPPEGMRAPVNRPLSPRAESPVDGAGTPSDVGTGEPQPTQELPDTPSEDSWEFGFGDDDEGEGESLPPDSSPPPVVSSGDAEKPAESLSEPAKDPLEAEVAKLVAKPATTRSDELEARKQKLLKEYADAGKYLSDIDGKQEHLDEVPQVQARLGRLAEEINGNEYDYEEALRDELTPLKSSKEVADKITDLELWMEDTQAEVRRLRADGRTLRADKLNAAWEKVEIHVAELKVARKHLATKEGVERQVRKEALEAVREEFKRQAQELYDKIRYRFNELQAADKRKAFEAIPMEEQETFEQEYAVAYKAARERMDKALRSRRDGRTRNRDNSRGVVARERAQVYTVGPGAFK